MQLSTRFIVDAGFAAPFIYLVRFRALWSWIVCVLVTIVVGLFTTPQICPRAAGLVRAYMAIPGDGDVPLYRRPVFWAVGVAVPEPLNPVRNPPLEPLIHLRR